MPSPANTPIRLGSIFHLSQLSSQPPGTPFQLGPITWHQLFAIATGEETDPTAGEAEAQAHRRCAQQILEYLGAEGGPPTQPLLISGYISGHPESGSIPFLSLTSAEPKPSPRLDCMTGLPLDTESTAMTPQPDPQPNPDPDRAAQRRFLAAQLANLLTQTMSPAERIAILSRLLADAICEDAAICSHSAPQYLSELQANLADAESRIREHLGFR